MKKSISDLTSDKYGFKTLFHAAMGILILIACALTSSLPMALLQRALKRELPLLEVSVTAFLAITATVFLIFLYIAKVMRMTLSDFRIQEPRNLAVWVVCAAALPIAVSAFFILFVPGEFAVSSPGEGRTALIVANAVLNVAIGAGITEELVFRGFVMRLLELRWNRTVAVIAPSVLFGLLHIINVEKPNIIDILLLTIAGTAVGIMFSLIACQSGSIWAGAIVHGVWNLIIIGGVFGIGTEPDAIFSYALSSDSILLTGGAFGIESSVPAVVGYCIVVALVWILSQRSSRG